MNALLRKLAEILEFRTTATESQAPAAVCDRRASKDVIFDHTNVLLDKIETLLASNDVEAIVAEAHALVGSAGSFGAVHFSMIARKLEQAIKSRQFDVVPLLVVDMRKASDRASAALAEWLKARITPMVPE